MVDVQDPIPVLGQLQLMPVVTDQLSMLIEIFRNVSSCGIRPAITRITCSEVLAADGRHFAVGKRGV
jgi:hypothetical protein